MNNTYNSKEESDKNIELFLFKGENCGICHALEPKLKTLLNEKYPEVQFTLIHVEDQPEVAAQFSVFSLPVVIINIHGKEQSRWMGSFSILEIEEKLTRFVNLLHSS